MTQQQRGQQPRASIRQPDDILLLEEDRAAHLASRLTLLQLDAIANDTRLPGEIAGSYGVSAGVMIRIQAEARRMQHQRENATVAARKLGEEN